MLVPPAWQKTHWMRVGKSGMHFVRLLWQTGCPLAEHLQQEFIGKFVGFHITVERRARQNDRLYLRAPAARPDQAWRNPNRRRLRGVDEDDDASPPLGRETEKGSVAVASAVVPDDALTSRHPGQLRFGYVNPQRWLNE
jgi:hypothetical protein